MIFFFNVRGSRRRASMVSSILRRPFACEILYVILVLITVLIGANLECSRFTIRRKIEGFKPSKMYDKLESHIKSLDYHGSINFWLVEGYSTFTIYSPHWINRLRMNNRVWWLCVLLQLWVVTWPIIWLIEKRYDVVSMVWKPTYGVYQDEANLADFWGPAVKQAVWTRRKSGTLATPDAEWLQGSSWDEMAKGWGENW